MRRSIQEKQELLIARLRKEEIARKTQARKLQNSGAMPSQWAGLMSVNRMISCNHMMKSSHQLELDHLRSKIKKENSTKKIVLVKKV